MNKETYSGWANYETWNCNLWYSEIFTEMAEQAYDQDRTIEMDELIEIVSGMFENAIEETCGIVDLPEGFAKDVALQAWGRIDWDEIAKHYVTDIFEL